MFFRYNVFTFCWMLLVLLLTLTPGDNMPKTSLWASILSFDTVAHFGIFAIMVFLMVIGLSKQYAYHFLRQKAVLVSLSVCILYGVLVEALQHLIPGRHFELFDILANSLGCLAGLGVFYLVYKF
jgi:VanZ family protein